MLTVAVLGPVEVRRDGEQLQLPAGKSTEVLVRLALDAGLAIRADRILEDLWATSAFGAGKNTLQSTPYVLLTWRPRRRNCCDRDSWQRR